MGLFLLHFLLTFAPQFFHGDFFFYFLMALDSGFKYVCHAYVILTSISARHFSGQYISETRICVLSLLAQL